MTEGSVGGNTTCPCPEMDCSGTEQAQQCMSAVKLAKQPCCNAQIKLMFCQNINCELCICARKLSELAA